MNTGKGIVLKLISAVLFAVMSALIRYLGARYPIGEVVFYRSAFAIVPVVVVYAWRGELATAVRTERPLGQASRGALSIVGMFCNFGALARLPLIEANAISFTSPPMARQESRVSRTTRTHRWRSCRGPLCSPRNMAPVSPTSIDSQRPRSSRKARVACVILPECSRR